jgi:hypothetical protein
MASGAPTPAGQGPPPYQMTTWLVLGAVLVLVLGLFSVRSEHQPDTSRDYPSRAMLPDAEPVLLPSPPVDEEYFPCGDCHEDETPNPKVRELVDEHDLLKLEHGDLWCIRCHDLENREKLHLADATLVGFEESWKLCTQCHGTKLAPWRAGVHGKRTGHWRGPKEYRTCVECHDPHSPAFKPLEPKPPPVRPGEIAVAHDGSEGNPDEQ